MRRAQAGKIVMRFAVVMLLLAAACRGDQSCPWLNAATASGVLGGNVKSQVGEGRCIFTHDSSQLRIEVHSIRLPYKLECSPNPAPLKAIGNEAWACSVEGKNGQLTEQVAGRVRDQAFFVHLTSNQIPRAAAAEKVRLVAEQVAGILF